MVPPRPAQILAEVMSRRQLAAELFDQLRRDGLDEPGVTRDPYGEGEQRGHATVRAVGERLGLSVDQDDVANLYMTWQGQDASTPGIMIGSHIDSVPHGGNFDGAAGVVSGLVAISALQSLGVTPKPSVKVMGIRAEESIWFEVSYVGSRGALGTLPQGALQARRRDTGRTLADHIDACGGKSSAMSARRPYLDPKAIAAFLELHIEQAPSLVAAGLPVGVCTGIPGNFRFPNAAIFGRHDHVGLPRRFRRDAAMAGAELALALDAVWEDHESRGIPMAFTLGRFHTDPALHGMTVVPGSFHFSLDVRAYDTEVLAELERKFSAIVAEIEQRRGVRFELGPKAQAAVGHVSPDIKAGLERSANAIGVSWMELGSPASHDAAAFAAAGVPVGMIFIRNENGSHNPDEAMEIDDFLAGTAVLANWLASSII